MNANVIKAYEDGKAVMIIPYKSGMPHSTIAMIIKNKKNLLEALKGVTLNKDS